MFKKNCKGEEKNKNNLYWIIFFKLKFIKFKKKLKRNKKQRSNMLIIDTKIYTALS